MATSASVSTSGVLWVTEGLLPADGRTHMRCLYICKSIVVLLYHQVALPSLPTISVPTYEVRIHTYVHGRMSVYM